MSDNRPIKSKLISSINYLRKSIIDIHPGKKRPGANCRTVHQKHWVRIVAISWCFIEINAMCAARLSIPSKHSNWVFEHGAVSFYYYQHSFLWHLSLIAVASFVITSSDTGLRPLPDWAASEPVSSNFKNTVSLNSFTSQFLPLIDNDFLRSLWCSFIALMDSSHRLQ